MVALLAVIAAVLVNCGKDNPATVPSEPPEPVNSQPVVREIADFTLEYGDSTTVQIVIDDADIDDTHTLTATCQGVTSYVEGRTITISAGDVGVATCMVYATDASNASSDSVTFQVTVFDPPVDRGACHAGIRIHPGQSCNYFSGSYLIRFSVNPDGIACRKGDKPIVTEGPFDTELTVRGLRNVCVNYAIRGDDLFNTRFAAEQGSDSSWTVEAVPCQIPPLDQYSENAPALFPSSLLLSNGEFAVYAIMLEELAPYAFTVGGRIESSTKFPIQHVGAYEVEADGEFRLIGTSVDDVTFGEVTVEEDYQYVYVNLPVQDIKLDRGLIEGVGMKGGYYVDCDANSDKFLRMGHTAKTFLQRHY